MAPLPEPAIWNPIAPIQNNWASIEPWHKGYMATLGALGTIFGLGATVALIVEHKGRLPKWPFTSERWNPKPTVDDKKKPEVSEEDIIEDELAEAVGALTKRSILEDDRLEWYKDDVLDDWVSTLVKRGIHLR